MVFCLKYLRAWISGSARPHTQASSDHPALPLGSMSALPAQLATNNSPPVVNTSVFSGGINHVHGGSYTLTINPAVGEAGIEQLIRAVVQDAMHDSQARWPPPRCHPSTRLAVVQDFLEWINSQSPYKPVYWLHAPYGHGKSAVMQTVIDHVGEEYRHLLAGSFFFKRRIEKDQEGDSEVKDDKPRSNQIKGLLTTIAYQIALNIPGVREHINNAMISDPSLSTKSLDIQLHRLIVEPLFKCRTGSHFQHTATVFIDGLDECDTIEAQQQVLRLISTAIEQGAPLRFIVASRPEAHIRDFFDQAPLNKLAEKIELPDEEAEVEAFLDARFGEIYDKRSRIMKDARVTKPWPAPEQIQGLIWRASGQYVFLETILRFVDTPRLNPDHQLRIVIDRLSDSSVFSVMDTIYHLILEQCPPMYQYILPIIFCCLRHHKATVSGIAEIWQIPLVDVRLAVDSLAAVVEEDEISGKLDFHHLSFGEFLESKDRCRHHYANGHVIFGTWSQGVRDAFKQALCGDRIFYDSTTWEFFNINLHYGDEDVYHWTTPLEMQDLLNRGRNMFQWGTDDLFHWYRAVELLRSAFEGFTWLQERDHRARWMAGKIDNPFTQEVHAHCLSIWKHIFRRAIAEISPELAGALLSLRPSADIAVYQVAKSARMSKDTCLRELNSIRFVLMCGTGYAFEFAEPLEPISSTNARFRLRGDDYIQYDSNGNETYIGSSRRGFLDIVVEQPKRVHYSG